MRDTSSGLRPAVSVVLPTYQRLEYVRRAVGSVLDQTYADFELIVVDDGSTDGTERALADVDRRLHYHRQSNRGVAAARNAGLRLARGDIVAFLDSDDRWLPDHLEVVTEMLERHPEAVLASTCPDYRTVGTAQPREAEVIDLLPTLLLGNDVGFVACVAVRREAVLAVGAFDERLPVWEDSDLWLRLAMLGPFCRLSRRTIVCQATRGGLKERGIESGAYLAAMEASARSAEEALQRFERPDVAELLSAVRSKILLVAGVRAVFSGEREAARSALEDACELMPNLSQTPGHVVGALRHGAVDSRVLLNGVMASAVVWPDPGSDTARFLWFWAAALAARTREYRKAALCLRKANLLADPAVLLRTRWLTAHLLQLWLHARRISGDETPADGTGRDSIAG